MKKRLYIALFSLLALAALVAIGGCVVLNQPRFGKLPNGAQRKRFEQSPNYRDGQFRYTIPTPLFSGDEGMLSVILGGRSDRSERLVPESPIPVLRTDLKALKPSEDTVVWFGHSSWFIQLGGKRILIDPVFSEYAAPFPSMNKAFEGTSIYSAEDMPEIDALLISHDHWDHLDYATAMALKPKAKRVICPLGLGASFARWGFADDVVSEGDWHDRITLGDDVTVHLLPARHYSGRGLQKNRTLWAGFALETQHRRIFFSGDSGYGPHFAELGKAFGGFDLALLDCGQYDRRWAYIHMTPEEAVQAAEDLGAQAVMPAHVGRFTIANHAWDEPFKRLKEASQGRPYRLLAPRIGEPATLNDTPLHFPDWWETDKTETKENGTMTIRVTANGKTTVFELNDSTAAKELYAQLPLDIKVEDYARKEKIFYPPRKLNTKDTPEANAQAGTLAYYAPWGDVVMFYRRFGSAAGLYELGHATAGSDNIEDMSGTIRIEKQKTP